MRRNAASQPLTNMFGIPVEFPDQWWRLSWLPFTCAAEETIAKQSSWERAWHGTKLEALYAIAYHGIILESSDETQGERFLTNGKGGYLHGDANRHKIGCYSRFVQLIPNGLYFAIHWEVRTDRKSRVTSARRTDQWIQPMQSVQLAALWVCVRDAMQMVDASPFSPMWIPALEASPFSSGVRARVQSALGGVGPQLCSSRP